LRELLERLSLMINVMDGSKIEKGFSLWQSQILFNGEGELSDMPCMSTCLISAEKDVYFSF
jgi:hypothetical protein